MTTIFSSSPRSILLHPDLTRPRPSFKSRYKLYIIHRVCPDPSCLSTTITIVLVLTLWCSPLTLQFIFGICEFGFHPPYHIMTFSRLGSVLLQLGTASHAQRSTHSFMNSFNKYLLNIFCAPSLESCSRPLCAGEWRTVTNKINTSFPALAKLIILWGDEGGRTDKQQLMTAQGG